MNEVIQNLIATNTIAQLQHRTDIPAIEASEVDEIRNVLWAKFVNEVKADATRQSEDANNCIQFDGSTMKYTIDLIGDKPARGFPVYICLHGGGGGNQNDAQWLAMQTYYQGSVQAGIYIAPRGIADTWNLHFMDQSYPMYDRLIENMIAFQDADPNRVYLLGFSAGGDGVYQVSARMADRWAASNMSSGHPNGVSAYNLYNSPFNIQVGEYDFSYDRNTEAAKFGQNLDSLATEAKDGYIHDVMVHRAGNHNTPWSDNNVDTISTYTIYKSADSWLPVWIKDTGDNWKNDALNKTCVKPGPDRYADPGMSCITDVDTRDVDSNAIRWVNAYARNPKPVRVRWDLNTIAPSRNGVAADKSQLFNSTERPGLFYWLDATKWDKKGDATVDIQADRASNTITVLKCINQVALLLSNDLVDMSKPINVVFGTDKFMAVVQPSVKDLLNSLVARGDQNYMFPAKLDLKQQAGSLMAGYNCYKLADVTTLGGNTPFSDVEKAAGLSAKLTSLIVSSGDVLTSLQATYGTVQFDRNGGPGDTKTTINLDNDEFITGLNGSYGSYFGFRHITQLNIVTNKRSYGPFGKNAYATNLQTFSFQVPAGLAINAFKGASDKHSDGTQYMSSLTVAFCNPTAV